MSLDDADALEDEDTVEATTRLTGQLLDTDEQPVADAEVVLVIGSVPATEPVRTDADGHYAIDIPTGRVAQAWASNFEVTVLFTQPSEDREPLGTAEGDLIHQLPVSLDEYVVLSDVKEGATLQLREAFVPRQGQGSLPHLRWRNRALRGGGDRQRGVRQPAEHHLGGDLIVFIPEPEAVDGVEVRVEAMMELDGGVRGDEVMVRLEWAGTES